MTFLPPAPPPPLHMLSATFRGTQMQHRGRSRHISPVALARQASEERRRSRIPLITDTQSGIPLPLPSTPAPPPQSLEDQIQVAYALDNIRLAKILLLKLKGILVTDDSDPRIDHVRDEDFDMCFAPSGPLTLDEADKRALQETQRKQRQWWHESQRAQRLRACEKLWEDEMNRLHAEKGRALQRREHDLEQERARLAERTTQQRGIKSRLETSLPTKRDQDPFQYPFMLPSKPPSTLPCKSSKKTLTRSPGRHNRSVSFKEVINAMNGQLFPPDASERVDDARRTAGLPIPCPAPHRRKASVRAELLDSLLHVVEWQQGERRKAKGKDVVCEQQPLKSQLSPPDPMPSVPSSLSVTSLSSSTSSSRSGSWLTFGSWRSTATDITTPDSPVSSPTSTQPCLPTLIETQRELHPHCAFVRISLSDTPLCLPTTSHHTVLEDGGPHAMPSGSAHESFPSLNMRGALVEHVTRSVATIIEAAKGPPICLHHRHDVHRRITICGSGHRDERGIAPLPKTSTPFTDSITSISQLSEPVHFIPLVSQPSGTAALPKPSVPKNALIFPSPLRPRTPPAVLAYRMRPVANPAVLRLRALQNLMCARGKEWEGRGREGGLGLRKERMLGVAFEGRGRSGLGCEVRFVVA
ncbi:hypothetical protein EV363DRAFT_1579946 [Boletus edulis]|nr:hypothetical protein EV363DRAFT_1579946 [Boletus edulis]